jgi:hypothetical protein
VYFHSQEVPPGKAFSFKVAGALKSRLFNSSAGMSCVQGTVAFGSVELSTGALTGGSVAGADCAGWGDEDDAPQASVLKVRASIAKTITKRKFLFIFHLFV